MDSLFQNVLFLVEQVGLGVFLVYLYGVFERREMATPLLETSIGAIFGVTCVLAMTDPITLSEGTIIDLRNLYVGLAAALFGWRGGVACAMVAVAARLIIGGAGAVAGMTGIIIAMVMGLLWAYHVKGRIKNPHLGFQVLALMISGHILAGLLLPIGNQQQFFSVHAPLMFLGNLIGVNMVGLMISREMHLAGENRRLLIAATRDALTNSLNRASAEAAYRRILAKPSARRGIAMTCIDLDKFKEINDTHGHLAGDRVLKEVAHRISTCLRSNDIFCRMSGDEFLFILVNVTSQEARHITERCRSLISRVPIIYEDKSIDTSISLGTLWSSRPLPFDAFRDKADEALYFAKAQGRNFSEFEVEHLTPSPTVTPAIA